MATDPVCGMQVDERTAAGSSVFEGGNYYFCCAGCKNKFDANPARVRWHGRLAGATEAARTRTFPRSRRNGCGFRYVRKPAVPSAVAPGAVYTCPMHPEIVRDGPGDCPICGMALVPIAGTGEADG